MNSEKGPALPATEVRDKVAVLLVGAGLVPSLASLGLQTRAGHCVPGTTESSARAEPHNNCILNLTIMRMPTEPMLVTGKVSSQEHFLHRWVCLDQRVWLFVRTQQQVPLQDWAFLGCQLTQVSRKQLQGWPGTLHLPFSPKDSAGNELKQLLCVPARL